MIRTGKLKLKADHKRAKIVRKETRLSHCAIRKSSGMRKMRSTRVSMTIMNTKQSRMISYENFFKITRLTQFLIWKRYRQSSS